MFKQPLQHLLKAGSRGLLFGRVGVLSALLITSPVWAKTQRYDLTLSEAKSVALNASKTTAHIVVNGQSPAPTLYFTEGDDAEITVRNQLKGSSAIHWHGVLLPGNMDGVSGLNGFASIPAGGQFTYRFPIRQSGSYWYHAHSNAQEQDGLYGGIVIQPKASKQADVAANVDAMLLITDAHPERGAAIFKRLKQDSEFYNRTRLSAADYAQQTQQQGLKATLSNMLMWGKMRMRANDLADISDYAFLLNGQSAQQPWRLRFNAGHTLRLRIVNSSAMSIFDVRIPQLRMTVVAADGQPVQPVTVDEFRFGVAETYDVLVQPQAGQNYSIVAESIDRQGYALGMLQDSNGNDQTIPAVQTRPMSLLSMADMAGHDMSAHQHGGSRMQMTTELPTEITVQKPADTHAAHHLHDMTQMSGMSMQDMHHMPSTEPTAPSTATPSANAASGWANANTPTGLKVLQYRDLQFLGEQPDQRPASRSIDIHLNGNMTRYIWTLNGKTYPDSTPIAVQYGERIRLNLINNSMMAHPMHLHGLFMQLDNGQSAAKMPNKHTVLVPPAQTVSVLVTASESGRWLLHCHLLYHMMAGMMTELDIVKPIAQMPNTTQHSMADMDMDNTADMDSKLTEHHHAH